MQEILIIEDSRTVVALLRRLLVPEGFRVRSAASGEEALKFIFSSLPDLILLDINMPGMDGFETCKLIKKNGLTANIPVIFVTASKDSEQVIKAFEAGGVDYITKPFNDQEVLARVKTHLQLRGLIQQHQKLIVDLREANNKLDEVSKTDLLTGLLNRRGMMDYLHGELARSQRTGKSFSIALGDVDHFKKVNDTYGHDIGDEVLKSISKTILSLTRRQDSVARWGGEEFLVLLPETEMENAKKVVGKLVKRFNSEEFEFQGLSFKTTLSFGLCVSNGQSSLDACLKEADDRLYRAKENGRNQFIAE